jgi:hypothetical protein
LAAQFVNSRPVDKPGGQPSLSTDRPLTNSAASPAPTRQKPCIFRCARNSRARGRLAAELVNSRPVDKPGGQPSLSTDRLLTLVLTFRCFDVAQTQRPITKGPQSAPRHTVAPRSNRLFSWVPGQGPGLKQRRMAAEANRTTPDRRGTPAGELGVKIS